MEMLEMSQIMEIRVWLEMKTEKMEKKNNVHFSRAGRIYQGKAQYFIQGMVLTQRQAAKHDEGFLGLKFQGVAWVL